MATTHESTLSLLVSDSNRHTCTQTHAHRQAHTHTSKCRATLILSQMNECFRWGFPPGTCGQREWVAISAVVHEGGGLSDLTAERGLLLELWSRPLLLTHAADSKPWVYGRSECGGSLVWKLLYHILHMYRSRLDSRGTSGEGLCTSSVFTDLVHFDWGQW